MNPKVVKACLAMKEFDIPEHRTCAALERLLELYENEWNFIEADKYKILLDFIIPDNEEGVKSKNIEAPSSAKEVGEPSRKRYRTRYQRQQALHLVESSQKFFNPSRNAYEFYDDEESDCKPLVRKRCRVQAIVNNVGTSNAHDITRGHERVEIFVEDGISVQLPTFSYIPENIIYDKAPVSFTLDRIDDKNFCSHCSGDCLKSSSCVCAIANGGDFAYTPRGLVKEKFLDACISMKCNPKQHLRFCTKNCPLVRSKNYKSSVTCKGHLPQQFIKECWDKCSCNKISCGNRIVQRGITVKLEVFLKSEGKGLGLRTLEALSRGTFVCEYIGLIKTVNELHEQSIRSNFHVLLDSEWGSQDVLNDDEALCLDNALYGNVAKFINHRCYDATLVEIPVEVETPDHHYYHVALFTTRDVGAMEELNWDYGIAFGNCDSSENRVRCACGSQLCRDRKEVEREIRNTYVRRQFKNQKKDGVLYDDLAKGLAKGTLPTGSLSEPVGDYHASSSSTTCYLAEKVANLGAQVKALEAAREKERMTYCTMLQYAFQQLETRVSGFKSPQALLQMQQEHDVDGDPK